jgi:hypothetical protein
MKKMDYLIDSQNRREELYSIANFKVYDNNNFSLYDRAKQKIYLIDSNFVIKQIYDFKDSYNFLVQRVISDHVFKNNILYYLDDSFSIKYFDKINMRTGSIPLSIEDIYLNSDNIVKGSLNTIDFITDNQWLIGINGIYSHGNNEGSFRVAFICNSNGEIIAKLDIDKKELNNPKGVYDRSYASYNENKIYITFETSKTILIYNKDYNLLNTKKILTNPEFWIKPVPEGKKIKYVILNFAPLSFNNNFFFHSLNNGPNKNQVIVKYNSDCEAVNKYVLDNRLDLLDFHLTASAKCLYAWNRNHPDIYIIPYTYF